MSQAVGFTGKAQKQYGKLDQDLQDVIDALIADLKIQGPIQPGCKHSSTLRQKGERYRHWRLDEQGQKLFEDHCRNERVIAS